jgi:hypothetical protein
MRRVGRFCFRTAILAWIALLAIMANSMVASAALDTAPAATNSAPSSAAILTVQPMTINGSTAQSITILSTDNVVIVSPLAGINFFYDTACSVINGTVGSPYNDSAINARADWGSTFSVAPTASGPDQVVDCHQITIVDPTPTPTPTNTPVPTAPPTNTPIPTATPTSTSTPVPTPTLGPDQIRINGSEASSVTVIADSRIHIESASGWIAFYSDDACGDLSGTERSPFDQPASFYLGLYGPSFSVGGVTEQNVPTTSCRQVSIVDPTPTPTGTPTATATPTPRPGPYLAINGYLERTVYVVWNVSETATVDFEAYNVADDETFTLNAYRGTCDALPNRPNYSQTSHEGESFVNIPLSDFFIYVQPVNNAIAVNGVRSSDGAQSPCQTIVFVREGEEPPTATPSSPVTPTPPASAPTATSSAVVTDLPRTGSGSGSSPVFPTLILVIAMALLVVPVSIERWRRRKASQ